MENLGKLEALSEKELMEIDGGKTSFWYDVAYGIGWWARGYMDQVGRWGGTGAF